MNLKTLETSLHKIGYITQIHESINSLTIALPDVDGNPKFGSNSRIEIIKNNVSYIFYTGQIPVEKNFDDENKLIEFIKEKFPIEN